MNRLLTLAVAASLALSACSKSDAPSNHAIVEGMNSGKLLQVQQAGMYTYAEVDMGGQKIWIAGGPLQAKVGDTVQWGQYAVMNNFEAKSLGRKFDQILFVETWGQAGGSVSQVAPHGTYPGQQAMPLATAAAGGAHAGHGAPAAGGGANQGEVKSVTASGGYSYLEVNQGGSTVWIAAPETPVKVGDKVAWDGGAVMQNFTANSLGRTFDQIVFAGGVTVVK